MQISLRSQMIAGATALVGATAVAMTPIAPAVSLPALSANTANIALAAWASPVGALLSSADVAVNYLISPYYQTGTDSGASNWGFESGVTDNVNDNILPYSYWDSTSGPFLPAVTAVGVIPNFISVPFPIASQVLQNWLDYAVTTWNAGVNAVSSLTNALWAPVELTAAIVSAVVSGQISTIPTLISDSVTQVVNDLTNAAAIVVGDATYIVQSVVAKATAAIQVLAAAIPAVLTNTVTQITTLATTAQVVFGNVTTALASGNVNEAWNAAVTGLLSPGVDGGVTIPGDLLNLTLGVGVQNGAVTDATSYAANFVPSVRNELQSLGQGLSIALSTPAPLAAASARSAAAKTARAASAAPVAAADTATADSSAAAAPAKKAPVKVGRHAAAAKAAAAKAAAGK